MLKWLWVTFCRAVAHQKSMALLCGSCWSERVLPGTLLSLPTATEEWWQLICWENTLRSSVTECLLSPSPTLFIKLITAPHQWRNSSKRCDWPWPWPQSWPWLYFVFLLMWWWYEILFHFWRLFYSIFRWLLTFLFLLRTVTVCDSSYYL